MTHTLKRGGLIKLATGVPGFDGITGGGLPHGRSTLILGGPGAGKTVFALQNLVAGVLRGDPGILVTFQESPRQIAENAATFGWNLAELERDKLVILDARIRPNVLKSIDLYLTGMLAGVRLVANEMGARLIVFDSLDALLSLLGDRTAERHEMFRLREWLLESGLTAFITAQAEGDVPFVSQRHAFMQFMADCVVNLNYDMSNPNGSRALRVLKYRGSGFAEDEFPFSIGPRGMEVACGPKAATAHQVFCDTTVGIHEEIKRARGELKARLESQRRRSEIKQAERDFLRKIQAKQRSAATRSGKTSARTGPRSVAPRAKSPSASKLRAATESAVAHKAD